ncbi:MAG: hypothetical protein ABFD82_03925 [Syntrophaceae bacterium]
MILHGLLTNREQGEKLEIRKQNNIKPVTAIGLSPNLLSLYVRILA